MESMILEFLEEDWFEKEPTARIDEDLLYTLYCGWCMEKGHDAAKRDFFFQTLVGTKLQFKLRNGLVSGIRPSKTGRAMIRSALQDMLDKPPLDFES